MEERLVQWALKYITNNAILYDIQLILKLYAQFTIINNLKDI